MASVGYNGGMVEGEELGRRLKAIRELRGVSQTDLGEQLAAEGFGKHDIGRVERGGMVMQGALRREAARLLGVPPEVFTVDDVDDVLWRSDATQLGRIEGRLRAIEDLLRLRGDADAQSSQASPARQLADFSQRERDRDERENPPAEDSDADTG